MRFNWLIPTTLGITSALVWTLPADAAQLQSWWFDARQNRLVFTTDTGVQPQAQMIFNPTRIVIDLPGTTLGRPTANQTVGGAVREVRVGQFNATTTRLVIELSEGYTVNPRQIQVQGVRSNEWVVQLPTPERTNPSAPPIAGGNQPNAVNGTLVRGAGTQVDNVLTTPDGFFVRTRGQAPNIEVERRGGGNQPRQILINIRDSSISPLLRAQALPVNRYSVARWEVNQQEDPAVTQLVLTLAEGSPDWQVTASRLGGIVLLPPPGTAIASIPDQSPRVSSSIPVPPGSNPAPLPPRPQPTTPLPPINNSQVVVVLDPGHGGRDPGAVGRGGLQEKTVVLPVSLRVAEILRAQGVQVILTRPDDRTLDLQPRVDIANQANATIFISIHANAISLSRPEVNGIETYYFSESGRRLAEVIHDTILPVSGMRDRGVKQARFFVLRNTAMPAALLEIGFVTGSEDVTRLTDPAWRERMAQAIADGILRYLQGG